jgi:hypothetical protein
MMAPAPFAIGYREATSAGTNCARPPTRSVRAGDSPNLKTNNIHRLSNRWILERGPLTAPSARRAISGLVACQRRTVGIDADHPGKVPMR